jgi:phosphatidylglycerophosphate synthase
MKRNAPNFITFLRIIGALWLCFIRPFTTAFYVVYTICGISDMLDGWVARMTGSAGEFGAKLDSIADLLFYSVMLLRIFPALWGRLTAGIWYGAGVVLLFRLASYLTAALKYRRFASLHTYLNKLTGLGVFFVPYMVGTPCAVTYCGAVCILAGAASAEELLLHLGQPVYTPDIKTIFSRKN